MWTFFRRGQVVQTWMWSEVLAQARLLENELQLLPYDWKWPPLQPLKVSALVIILQPYFSRSLVRNKRPYIRLVSN